MDWSWLHDPKFQTTYVQTTWEPAIKPNSSMVSNGSSFRESRGFPNDKRQKTESRDTGRSSPVNFEASNEKQLGRHALRFCRFAGVVAEIERIRAWTRDGMELTEQRTEAPGIAAVEKTKGDRKGEEKRGKKRRKRVNGKIDNRGETGEERKGKERKRERERRGERVVNGEGRNGWMEQRKKEEAANGRSFNNCRWSERRHDGRQPKRHTGGRGAYPYAAHRVATIWNYIRWLRGIFLFVPFPLLSPPFSFPRSSPAAPYVRIWLQSYSGCSRKSQARVRPRAQYE